LTVTNNLDDGSAGSLRYEINKAHKGDTIIFAPSLDGQTIWLRGELDLTKSLTIQGPGAGLLTINGGADGVDDAIGHRVFAVEKSTNVTLSGLTITGGDGILAPGYFSPYDNEGGGILNLGTLTVSGCTISGNHCNPETGNSYGGGIYNLGTLTVTGSTVSGNSVHPDPSGFSYGAGTPLSGYGGGIYNAGSLTVTASTISGNFAETDGGGIYNAGTATVTDSILSSNSCSSQGGGIYNSGSLTISGCTVSNNSADSGNGGGGIYNAGTLAVSNSTFSGNWIPVETAPNNNNIFGPYTDGGGNTFN
jgi:hypothetical protein